MGSERRLELGSCRTTPPRNDVPSSAAPRSERAVGGDDLDRAGQVGEGQVVEEATLGEAGVGQEVAVPGRARPPGPGSRSSPVSRPATPMLPPKKSLATARTADVVARDARPPGGRAPGRRTSPVRMVTGRSSAPAARHGAGRDRPGGPVARGRGPVHRGEEAVADAPGPVGGRDRRRRPRRPGPCRCRSRAGGTRRRCRPAGRAARPSGSTRRRRRPGDDRGVRRKISCHSRHGVDDEAASSVGVGAHRGFLGEVAHARGGRRPPWPASGTGRGRRPGCPRGRRRR